MTALRIRRLPKRQRGITANKRFALRGLMNQRRSKLRALDPAKVSNEASFEVFTILKGINLPLDEINENSASRIAEKEEQVYLRF